MSGGIERLGRVNHPVLGPCVRVKIQTWSSPEKPGQNGKYIMHDELFPIDQSKHEMHPRHPTGYDVNNIEKRSSISPSCSFYADLCRYAGFSWRKRKQHERGAPFKGDA